MGGVQHAAHEVSGVCGDPGCYGLLPGCYGLCYLVAMDYVTWLLWIMLHVCMYVWLHMAGGHFR